MAALKWRGSGKSSKARRQHALGGGGGGGGGNAGRGGGAGSCPRESCLLGVVVVAMADVGDSEEQVDAAGVLLALVIVSWLRTRGPFCLPVRWW
jgi:hypothetical protein